MLNDDEHAELIQSLRDHVGRVTIRSPPPVAVLRAIRALEETRVEMKRLQSMNKKLEQTGANLLDPVV